ncbi:MAG: sugar ABC transporter substrate-binding protein [Eubacteriales bacterium]|jgi:ABC-type sugar transport system substrate-binding protein|nr:sugar ABC transporter substrate-binding protein [Eubacteriales bacterium]MDD3572837.1 sugar ABC transporter substrate-binding protein [Eubacteriales bacterium]MDD4135330.1 sugar ABC transporter substrate-binding protein [Eubacteriales bacterium]
MKKLVSVILAVLMLMAATAGLAAEETKIGVSIMELSAYTWYLGVIDGCEQWAEENPQAGFVFQFEDSRSDVSTMLNNIDNLLTWGAKGIILFPADASSAIPTMKQYTQQGIPFVIGDYAQQPNSDEDIVWKTFVGHNMKQLGIKAGEVAVEYLKTLGKEEPVCLFITRPTSGQVSADRFNGFSETVLAAFPKARIIEEGDVGAGSRDSSQSLMENVLQREAVIDVVSGHNDAEVVGPYNAAIAANRTEIKFIGIAGDKDVLTYVTEGNPMWLGEVLQNPVDLGYQATKAMYETLVEGKEIPLVWDLPLPEAITPDNVKDYDWQSWGWL